MADMAHISGLVATGEAQSPFAYSDIVTTTTHKSLRGPRAGMIFFRRGPKSDAEGAEKYEYEDAINFAVFPSLQGGPHNHQIAGLATQLKEVATPEFKAYAKQVRANAQALAKFLIGKGYKLTTNGTENHLMLWDLRPLGLTGSKVALTLTITPTLTITLTIILTLTLTVPNHHPNPNPNPNPYPYPYPYP